MPAIQHRRIRLSLLTLLAVITSSVLVAPSASAATTPLPLGTPTTVALTVAAPTADFTLDITDPNAKVTVKADQGTAPYGVGVSLSPPTGGGGSAALVSAGADGYLEIPVLQRTGTWRLRTQINGRFAGDPPLPGGVRLLVNQVSNVTGTISIGSTFTQALTQPGQDAELTFPGTAGQTLALDVSGQTVIGGVNKQPSISGTLVSPDGQTNILLGRTPESFWPAPQALTATGTWTLLLNPSFDATGSITGRLRALTTITRGPLTEGVTKPVALGAAGDNVKLTFTGVKGRRPTFTTTNRVLNSVSGGANPDYELGAEYYRPDGSLAWSNALNSWSEGPVLDTNGTWTLVINPPYDVTGSLSLTLRSVKDVTAALPLNRTATLTSSTRGVDTNLTFNATVGRVLRLTVTRQNWTSLNRGGAAGSGDAILVFLRPDGSEAAQRALPFADGETTKVIDSPVLDVPGTWTLRLNPIDDTTGQVTGRAQLVRP